MYILLGHRRTEEYFQNSLSSNKVHGFSREGWHDTTHTSSSTWQNGINMASTLSRRRHNGNGLLLFDNGPKDLSADKTRMLYTSNSQLLKGALQGNIIDLMQSLEEKISPSKENQLRSALKYYYDCLMTKDEQDRTLGEDFKLQTSLIQGIRGKTGDKCCSKSQRHHHGKG